MLRALFVTTATSDSVESVNAWARTMGPVTHIAFDHGAQPIDEEILRRARADVAPDLTIYIGPTDGPGVPSYETLRQLRKIAPLALMMGDGADPPWHPFIKRYREEGCFDLIVSIDGVKSAPVDLVSISPLDPDQFRAPPRRRNVRCGFAGGFISRARYDEIISYGLPADPRSVTLHSLGNLVQLREREVAGRYANYIAFFRRCQIVINTAWTGSGTTLHMKGRLLEAGFSGAAILEMKGSPIGQWFPEGSYFTYGSLQEAEDVIRHADDADIAERAKAFEAHAREHYTADKIYGRIVERLGL